MMKGGMAGLMKQAQQMQEKCRRCRKNWPTPKSPVSRVAVW